MMKKVIASFAVILMSCQVSSAHPGHEGADDWSHTMTDPSHIAYLVVLVGVVLFGLSMMGYHTWLQRGAKE